MKINYDPNYFLLANPNIGENEDLREPQIAAYYHAYEHFIKRGKKSHALIVLPTGVGKTGLMGLLPYNISKGRVLIITPQLTIKDTVVDSLDPDHPNNFWLKRKVFNDIKTLPSLVEYQGDNSSREILELANIIVLNIHKLQSRLDSSFLNFLPKDFFDMIIIDEAHHSSANTWVQTLQYFSNAKVIKLTGTPFRSDDKEIAGELIFKYKLSQAMASDYVKSLRNITYIPEELLLTIDNDVTKKYSVQELLESGIKDEDYISRSVAYSYECSEKVVNKSIELLEEKLSISKVPHKIIAVACSISHAEQIKEIYEKNGYSSAIVHSGMEKADIEEAMLDIKNHRVKVVVNVAMLGEGYDHCYLSIAAIFRPFRNELPYSQFIGRILRRIPDDEASHSSDNIGEIVSHKHLCLDKLWEKYKVEIQESEIIKHLKDIDEINDYEDKHDKSEGKVIEVDFGKAIEIGVGKVETDDYLTTELLKRHKEEEKTREEKINKIQELLNLGREEAITIINSAESESSSIKRPDKYFSQKRKDIDVFIKEEIVPNLINKYNVNQKGNDLINCRLFTNQYSWIKKGVKDNGGMLAVYFEQYLKNEIGLPRKEWKLSDYDIAFEKLDQAEEFVKIVLEGYFN